MHLLGKIIKKGNIIKINNNIKCDRKKYKFKEKTDRKFNIYYLLFYSLIFISILILMTSCKGAKEVEEPIKPTEEGEAEVVEGGEVEVTREAKIEKILKGEEEPLEPTFEELSGIRSLYSGVEVSEQQRKERPIVILVENLCEPGGQCVRPQDGLADADIVIEVTDEGGITRYIVIFGADKIVNEIGPFRSSRPYYSEIAFGFDPLFVHFGASGTGYENIDHLGILDLCAARTKAPHWRDTSRGLDSEHTAYTKTTDLRQAAKDLGYDLEGGKSPLKFKADALEDERGEEDIIIIDITRPPYQAKYVYNKETNSYTKYVGGVLHTDRKSGKQIIAKNIIVQITDITRDISSEKGHMVVRTAGYGDALFFMDGKVIKGTWSRTSVADPYLYLDEEGRPIGFNVGSTWISFIPSLDRVSSTNLQ